MHRFFADEPVMVPNKKPINSWVVTGINLLAWPGIGTYVGGQKVVGAIQAALALAGGLLSLSLILVMFRFVAMRLDSVQFDTDSFMEANGTLLGLGGGGLGLLAIAWVWAAVSSFQIATRLKTRD
ncbi:uncharacterized protein METZ01_LOCUS325035 [marine metagenome]|uniref:Uncharacterized protein n=1 Tax=marine metagenome TaxID=408172 RepID=A0A382PJS8_9ZZZZ